MREDTRLADRRVHVEYAAVRALAETGTLHAAAPKILEGICKALGWDFGALWLRDTSANELRCVELWRRDDRRLEPFERATRGRLFPRGTGLPGRVWETGEPVWMRDVVADLKFPRSPIAVEAGLHGAFGFPIVVGGEMFGVMEFFSQEIHEPDEDLLQMLGGIGTEIGQFVEREEMGRRLEFQRALLESQSEASLDGVIVISSDKRVLHWNHRLKEMWDVSEEMLTAGDSLAVMREMARKTSSPDVFIEIAEAILSDPTTSRRDEITLADGRSFDLWTAPVQARDGIAYGRALYYRDVTDQKRKERVLRQSEQWVTFLGGLTTLLSESLDYKESLNRLVRLCVPWLGEWCAIHVVEPGTSIELVAVAHSGPERVAEARRVLERQTTDPKAGVGVGNVVRTGESELYEDLSKELLPALARDEKELEALRSLRFGSAMIVPIITRGRVLGTISFVSVDPGRRYTKEDLQRAEDLAARVGLPIDNTRLYQERTRVAQTLQESLLPPELPEIQGVELAARYQPVAESADVGGDFYDAFSVGPRSWGLVLGDVSGKGVEAAAVTSLARHTLRAAAMTTHKPSAILSMLNAALMDQTEHDRFCTGIFALLEPRFGRVSVTVSCGGHPVPYLVRSNGDLQPLKCEGTLLGVVPNPDLKDVSVDLNFGDKLMLYTDGLLDVRPRDERFGQAQLETLFAECSRRGVAASADFIERRIRELQGGPARDDFALIIVGVRASIFRRAATPRLWVRRS